MSAVAPDAVGPLDKFCWSLSPMANTTTITSACTSEYFHFMQGWFSRFARNLGQLSDRIGRKTILLVCAGGIVLSYATISAAFASGSVFLLMGREISGRHYCGKPSYIACGLGRYLSARKERLPAKYGTARIISLGFVIGPALSGFLSDHIVSWFSIHTPLQATVLLVQRIR
jgi:MFS family permease